MMAVQTVSPASDDYTLGDVLRGWLFLLLPGSLLLVLLVSVAAWYEQDRQYQGLAEREHYVLAQSANRITGELGSLVGDLQLLASITSHELNEEASDSAAWAHMSHLYLDFVRDTERYFQVRFIDLTGHERVRVDYRQGEAHLVPTDALQDKSGRYYVRDTLALPDGAIYVSPFDLNVERGEIERPLRPALRLARVVTDARAERRGLVILNYQGDLLLEQLRQAALNSVGEPMLLNSEGYWLYHQQPELRWGFMLDERRYARFQGYWPESWRRIKEGAYQGQLVGDEGLFTYRLLYSPGDSPDVEHTRWLLVSHVSNEQLQLMRQNIRQPLILLLIPLWLILLFGTRQLAVAQLRRRRAEHGLQKSNEQLERRVAERTFELTEEVTERRRIEGELRKLARAVKQSPDSVVITDDQGVIEYVNPHFEQNTGYRIGEVRGQTLRFLRSGNTPLEVYQELWETIKSGQVWRGELQNRRKSGQLFWELVSISPVRDEEGHISHYVAIKSDITQQKALQDDLRLAASVFEASAEGIMITDSQRHILRVNRAFSDITGYSPEEVLGKNPSLLNSGEHDAQFFREMWHEIKEQGHWSGEITNRNRDGERYPEWLTISAVRNSQGETTHYIAIFTDIRERKRAEQRIEHLAYYDALTHLPNRTLLLERLRHDINHAHRANQILAVLFIDLDGFKTVNDSLGHEQGDQLLVEVAERLTSTLREDDTVARLGGDEFVILLAGLNGDAQCAVSDTISVCEKIRTLLGRPFTLGGYEALVTPSIGIALYPNDGHKCDELLKHADAAMYQAKEFGRDNFQFFAASMRSTALERLKLESALRHAISEQQFELHFQPQVTLVDGRILGAEALLRWPRAEGHNIGATIAAAERSGQILALGNWVLDSALAQLAHWERSHRLPLEWRLAVNISPRQFQQAGFVEQVEQAIKQHGVSPGHVELEVTEGLFIQNLDEVASKLHRLKALGIRIAIDDFGTGYSSLSYLKQLPVDALKIDQSFVRDIIVERTDTAIVQTIVAMAKGLSMAVIAEGVEQDE